MRAAVVVSRVRVVVTTHVVPQKQMLDVVAASRARVVATINVALRLFWIIAVSAAVTAQTTRVAVVSSRVQVVAI